MYVDQRTRERRAKSVVVSGLQPSGDINVSDATTFQRICSSELGISPTIIFTRRLGVATEGRIRSLLVGLQSAEDLTTLLMCVKQLRRSTTESIRRNVFINRNMTKVEARMAYQERCRRRSRQRTSDQLAAQHGHDEQRYLCMANNSRSETATIRSSGESFAAATLPQSADVSMSPTASEFIPVASASSTDGRHR